jgi:glutathione synthase/RimK-type ligase-like ATP-grasp enzyme
VSKAPQIAVFYEHPHWFKPLFRALERRAIPYQMWHADHHRLNLVDQHLLFNGEAPDLIINRLSPSAWQRGRSHLMAYTSAALATWEGHGVRVFNGSKSWEFEISKARQVALMHQLGVSTPRTMVVHSLDQLAIAAATLTAPYVVKPNIGGSGAGILRFDSEAALQESVAAGVIPSGPDNVWLLQEFHPPEDQAIYRVETLLGSYLYGIRIGLDADAGFDLCPADICRTSNGAALVSEACPAEARKSGMAVQADTPPAAAIQTVERLVRAAGIDVGGVEFLRSSRDGQIYFYDINALSNFVADPIQVLGFDPTERLVDALVAAAESRTP